MRTFSSHENSFLDYVRYVVTTYPGFILGAIAKEQLRSLHEAEYFGSREAGYDFDSGQGQVSHARRVLSGIISISGKVPLDPTPWVDHRTGLRFGSCPGYIAFYLEFFPRPQYNQNRKAYKR